MTRHAYLPQEEDELIFNDLLNPLGIRIQSRLRVLICTHCEAALLPKSVLRHFADHHSHLHSQVKEQDIADVANYWGLCNEMPKIQSAVVYYQGLTLVQGCVKCVYCQQVFGKSTMPSHHSNAHRGIPAPNFNKLPPVYAQRLNNGQHRSLFEVIVPSVATVPVSTNMIVEHLRVSRDNIIPEYFPTSPDPRALSSWMKYTGWHAFVAPHPTSDLIAFVAMPHKDENSFEHIKKAVTEIFDIGYHNIAITNTIVLQKLKTDNLAGV